MPIEWHFATMLKILNQVLQDIHADRQAVYNTYPDIRQKGTLFYQHQLNTG